MVSRRLFPDSSVSLFFLRPETLRRNRRLSRSDSSLSVKRVARQGRHYKPGCRGHSASNVCQKGAIVAWPTLASWLGCGVRTRFDCFCVSLLSCLPHVWVASRLERQRHPVSTTLDLVRVDSAELVYCMDAETILSDSPSPRLGGVFGQQWGPGARLSLRLWNPAFFVRTRLWHLCTSLPIEFPLQAVCSGCVCSSLPGVTVVIPVAIDF